MRLLLLSIIFVDVANERNSMNIFSFYCKASYVNTAGRGIAELKPVFDGRR